MGFFSFLFPIIDAKRDLTRRTKSELLFFSPFFSFTTSYSHIHTLSPIKTRVLYLPRLYAHHLNGCRAGGSSAMSFSFRCASLTFKQIKFVLSAGVRAILRREWQTQFASSFSLLLLYHNPVLMFKWYSNEYQTFVLLSYQMTTHDSLFFFGPLFQMFMWHMLNNLHTYWVYLS